MIPPESIITGRGDAGSNFQLIAPAPIGDAVEFAFYYFEGVVTVDESSVHGASLLCSTVLPSGETFFAVHSHRPLSIEDRAAIDGYVKRARSEPPTWATRSLEQRDDDAAMLLGGIQADGHHRLVDLDLGR